jgi:gas vesicle protein
MRIHRIIMTVGLATAFAGVLGAQEPTEAKKPGGLNKVAHDVSKASKKAGRDAKEGLKDASSATHQTLKKAGNDTKAEAKRATGYVPPDSGHKPGGLNKAAREVSKVGKKTGAKAKHGVKKGASEAHGALTTAGKATKDTLKAIKPPIG